jgi:hypothetical protein
MDHRGSNWIRDIISIFHLGPMTRHRELKHFLNNDHNAEYTPLNDRVFSPLQNDEPPNAVVNVSYASCCRSTESIPYTQP